MTFIEASPNPRNIPELTPKVGHEGDKYGYLRTQAKRAPIKIQMLHQRNGEEDNWEKH